MTEYKNYRKKNLQPMRPYIPGEDLTGVSVSPEDTPEEGGMIANDNYEAVEPGDFRQRVIAEREELNLKIEKLGSFLSGPAMIEAKEHDRLWLQKGYMREYLEMLDQRIECFEKE